MGLTEMDMETPARTIEVRASKPGEDVIAIVHMQPDGGHWTRYLHRADPGYQEALGAMTKAPA